jgi:hypothetical protein
MKCCGTLSGQVCYTLTSSVRQESNSVTIVAGGDGNVFHTHGHRIYLSGMLKQKTHQQCCFTINQVLNKPTRKIDVILKISWRILNVCEVNFSQMVTL